MTPRPAGPRRTSRARRRGEGSAGRGPGPVAAVRGSGPVRTGPDGASRRGWSAAIATLTLTVALTACGGGAGPADRSDDERPTAEATTPRALAAAVIDHVGRPASAAAPLFRRDGVPSGALGVEVAFPDDRGISTHVRVVVSRRTEAFERFTCNSRATRFATGCEESSPGGVRTALSWEAGYPEEDPGSLSVAGLHDGWTVTISSHGPFFEEELGDERALADRLVDLAADPAVGFRTSASYVEAGAAIGDDVWLDYYGQGNGYPPPPELKDPGATG
ncbi:hypothetical protein [Nocardioides sp. P86]|uniref:hypothetical protein n=1 Tax=Nocardioides sp. P86 TaxID=2939569 RepID=UPI00203B3AD8|nr:hypothetical protein [Nocardioides sp. P86]MCM3516521.1 hypothetical protein [Nocardioides sp. P86]